MPYTIPRRKSNTNALLDAVYIQVKVGSYEVDVWVKTRLV